MPPEGWSTNVAPMLLQLVEDPNIRVRYQLAFTLGACQAPDAGAALVRLALRDLENVPLQTAVLSSAPPHVGEMLHTVLAAQREPSPPEGLLAQLLGLASSMQQDQAIAEGLEKIATLDPRRVRDPSKPVIAGKSQALLAPAQRAAV